MSLYDDFKKEKKVPNNEKQNVNAVENNDDNNSVSIDGEVYNVFHEPFYKKKEFYILCMLVVLIISLVGFFLYTPKFEMENLLGKEDSYAAAFSENYKLKYTYVEEHNDEYTSGLIFEQSLKANETYKEGTVLQVKISKGPDFTKEIPYPDFASMSHDEAVEWRSSNHAKGTTIEKEYNAGVPDGQFISEKLGDSVTKNKFKRESELKLIYSRGTAPVSDSVSVPDFANKPISEVALWAKTNSINVTVEEYFDDHIPQGTITSQNVAAGAKLKKDDTIVVQQSAGAGVIVPTYSNYTFENYATAGESIPVDVKQVYSSSVPKGKLISQSRAAGSKIKESDKVEVVYSLGKIPIANYVGMTYPEVSDMIYALNNQGANLTLHVVYWDRPQDAEGSVKGTIASQNHVNTYLNPGNGLTIAVYK